MDVAENPNRNRSPQRGLVLPALGNAQGNGARKGCFSAAQRANGFPCNRGEPLARWAEMRTARANATLGVAQVWANGWAFGPSQPGRFGAAARHRPLPYNLAAHLSRRFVAFGKAPG